MKRRLRMLATVSLLALAPCALRAGGIPVIDAAANASLVTQIAQGAEQLGQWAQQIKAMVAEYYHDFKEKKTPYQEGDRITYAARVFDEKEMCALTDATLDFWLTTGRFADRFEKEFAKWIGVKFAHLVNSGSSANLIAFMALTAPELGDRQIRKGDEIITVACGFPTTVTPAIQYGAVPVFVDVTVPQYNIDVTKLEAALSPKTKAVMIAHTLGNPFDLSAVKAFCDEHNLWLVEDCCDALGATYLGLAAETGIDPSLLHRVAVIGAGTLDSLPHNGAVVTLLAVCGSNHREAYLDLFMVAVVGAIAALAAVILVGSLVGSF